MVAAQHHLRVADLLGGRRFAPIARARHEAFYIAMSTTPYSIVAIAKRFNCDHTTVMNGAAHHAGIHNLPPPRDTIWARHRRHYGSQLIRDRSSDPWLLVCSMLGGMD
jgi:hypothetical protein